MHTFCENSYFSCSQAWQLLPEALQHLAKAFYCFLRFCDLHLSGRGKHLTVEVAAEIDRYLCAEMSCIDGLHRNILPEAVDNTVHQVVLAQQRHHTFLAV